MQSLTMIPIELCGFAENNEFLTLANGYSRSQSIRVGIRARDQEYLYVPGLVSNSGFRFKSEADQDSGLRQISNGVSHSRVVATRLMSLTRAVAR